MLIKCCQLFRMFVYNVSHNCGSLQAVQVTFVTPLSFHILQRRIWIMFTWTFWSPSCRSSRSDNLMTILFLLFFLEKKKLPSSQGCRSWQPFGEGKNGHQIFPQARIYYFHDKCVVFARNCKFANLNQQYIPCNSAHLAQETQFLTQKGTFFAQRSPKSA